MESEIRIIRLERETLYVNGGELEENIESNSQRSSSDEDTKYYFATDYFDALTVTKRYLNTPLATIMSIENEEERSGRKTSVQSYTIYYSQKMWEKYEQNQAENHQKNVRRGDPFEQDDASLRYLSIIQVHITPEILRRTTYGDKKLWDENSIILEPFIDDLYDVVEQYRKNQSGDNFIYRVYQVLSAGDLAVVVKSRFPETSYRISSAIRGRVVEENRDLPPLAVVHPYHSERIKAQKGVFTVFPFYREKEEDDSARAMAVNPDAMENNDIAESCLHKIVLSSPQKIAYEIMTNGMNNSWLYPEMPIVANELERHQIYS